MLPRGCGSLKKGLANVDHDREADHLHLYKDYFNSINPLFKEKSFRRRYTTLF
jgi:hypothetical protein